MQRFKNILVGVDLSRKHIHVSDQLSAPTGEAIRRALLLAKLNSARLTFVSVLDSVASQLSADREILLEADHGQRTVANHAGDVLGKLVDDSSRQGVTAESHVLFGKDWEELIREVLREQHDLVVVGSRQFGPIRQVLLGSTGRRLLRKCPCPVWVTRPCPREKYGRVLAAIDAGCNDDAHLQLNRKVMELATSLCERESSQLEVVQAWELIEDDRFVIEHRCDDLLRPFGLSHESPNVRLVHGKTRVVLEDFANEHEIDLMGSAPWPDTASPEPSLATRPKTFPALFIARFSRSNLTILSVRSTSMKNWQPSP